MNWNTARLKGSTPVNRRELFWREWHKKTKLYKNGGHILGRKVTNEHLEKMGNSKLGNDKTVRKQMRTVKEQCVNIDGAGKERWWNFEGAVREQSGNIDGTLCEHWWNTVWTLMERCVNTNGTLCEHWWNAVWTLMEDCVNTDGTVKKQLVYNARDTGNQTGYCQGGNTAQEK